MLAISAFAEVIRRTCFVLTLPNERWYVKLIIIFYQFVRHTAVVVLRKDGENTDTFLYKVKEKSLQLFTVSGIHTREHNAAFTVCKLAGHFFRPIGLLTGGKMSPLRLLMRQGPRY